MQVCVVIAGLEAAGIPAGGVEIGNRVQLLGNKAKKPVPRGVGGNMHLINAVDREHGFGVAVDFPDDTRILLVIGTFMLIDENPIIIQSLKAVAVKLTCKQALVRAEGV